MSVPPEMMKLMAGAGGSPGAGGAAPMPSAAGGAPMSNPQPPQGEKQSAMVNVSLALDLLEQTLMPLGSESEEGQAVMSAIQSLTKKFGHTRAKSQGLQPAELQQLMAALPGAGGMSPEAKAMGGQPMQMPGGMPH